MRNKFKSWHTDPAHRDLCNSNLFTVFLNLQTSRADVSQPAATDSSSELYGRCRTSSLKPSGSWWGCTVFVGLERSCVLHLGASIRLLWMLPSFSRSFPRCKCCGRLSKHSDSSLLSVHWKIIGEHNYSDSVRLNVFSLYSANSLQKAFQFTPSCAEQYRPHRPWHKGPLQTTIYISYLPKCLLQVTNGGLFKYLCHAANRLCISNTCGVKRNIFSCLYPFVVKMHWLWGQDWDEETLIRSQSWVWTFLYSYRVLYVWTDSWPITCMLFYFLFFNFKIIIIINNLFILFKTCILQLVRVFSVFNH